MTLVGEVGTTLLSSVVDEIGSPGMDPKAEIGRLKSFHGDQRATCAESPSLATTCLDPEPSEILPSHAVTVLWV